MEINMSQPVRLTIGLGEPMLIGHADPPLKVDFVDGKPSISVDKQAIAGMAALLRGLADNLDNLYSPSD